MNLEFLKSETCIIILLLSNIILVILTICNFIKYKTLNKRYKAFMKKLSRSSNIEESLKEYLEKVNLIKEEQKEVIESIKGIEQELALCTKKVGLVRYNAFKDTGSDLSFALAMLDSNNNGVILNGIYSREMSNIYAKNVKEGKSTSKLSEEEEQALREAMKI